MGGLNLYLLLQLQSLKKTVNSNSKLLANIKKFLEPANPDEELKPYELRVVVNQNKLSINRIEEKLKRNEELSLQAINNTASIIRHSKQHPITSDAVNKFIDEEGLLKDDSF